METLEDTMAIHATDLSASILALVNALVARKLITKAEIAAAAQERLLTLREKLPPATVERLALLHAMATKLEQVPDDM